MVSIIAIFTTNCSAQLENTSPFRKIELQFDDEKLNYWTSLSNHPEVKIVNTAARYYNESCSPIIVRIDLSPNIVLAGSEDVECSGHITLSVAYRRGSPHPSDEAIENALGILTEAADEFPSVTIRDLE